MPLRLLVVHCKLHWTSRSWKRWNIGAEKEKVIRNYFFFFFNVVENNNPLALNFLSWIPVLQVRESKIFVCVHASKYQQTQIDTVSHKMSNYFIRNLKSCLKAMFCYLCSRILETVLKGLDKAVHNNCTYLCTARGFLDHGLACSHLI